MSPPWKKGIVNKLTTEHTEKIFYFKKLTEILLPPLCVLSINIKAISCQPSALFLRTQRIPLGSRIPEGIRDSGLWFHIVPLFFIELLTVPKKDKNILRNNIFMTAEAFS
jgi:hypothetical protein